MNDEFLAYKNEYEDINKQLQDPQISQNPQKIKQLSLRVSYLTPIIEIISSLEEWESKLKSAEDVQKTETDSEIQALAQEEITLAKEEIVGLNEKFKTYTTKSDPDDQRNAILEIRAGTGGEEAALFVSNLYRMYLKYCEDNGWKVQQLNSNRTGNGGYKEVVALISGKSVYGKLKFENGVHRVQRIPATESSGRIHTSAASVVILPEVDDIDIIVVKPEDIRVDVFRAGGPGGQSVNTTDSAVRITHLPTGIVISCQDGKSQLKNKEQALSILKSRLYELEMEKQNEKQSDIRKSAIKSGDRSAKIRTYNYPQSRITDHRIKKSWYNLEEILSGALDDMITTVQKDLA